MSFLIDLTTAWIVAVTFYLFWQAIEPYLIFSPLDNIPGPAPGSLLKGNLGQFLDRHGWSFHTSLGQDFGGIVRLTGWFGRRQLYVFDPDALNNVIVKQQDVFEQNDGFLRTMHLMVGDGLLATLGERHRRQRKLLNPVFSASHMREITPIFYQVASTLCGAISNRLSQGEKELDMLDWMSRAALELIGQGGFGQSLDPLTSDNCSAYGAAIKTMVPTIFPLRLIRPFLPIFMSILPKALARRLIPLIPYEHLKRAQRISDTLDVESRKILAEKNKVIKASGSVDDLHEVIAGRDIMSKLLRANLLASGQDKLPEDEILGQMSTFAFAGMDTTSNALSRTLDLLAKHPDAQEKLRQEILGARADATGDIPYDQLVELPYLDAICRETLRLYPLVPFVNRTARQDAIIPLSTPIEGKNGAQITRIHVPKGTEVIVGILACNRNSSLWGPDAMEWKPERWLSPLPQELTNARVPGVYSHLMTFIGGKRACIGFKFSQLEMKVILSMLLANFKFTYTDKEIVWNVGGVSYPTVGYENYKPAMPMRVEHLSVSA